MEERKKIMIKRLSGGLILLCLTSISLGVTSGEVSITDTNKIASKMILKDNNRFVIYVDEEEKGLIKGFYEDWSSSSAKVLASSIFLANSSV